MSGTLRFEILGPQRAWYADRPVDLGPGKQRAVLAVLLLSAGRPVPTGQLLDAVWPEEPPANGPNVVQKYVAGLRRALEPDRSPRTPGRVLTLTDAGYLLRVPPESVDAVRFERGVHRAGQWHTAGRTADAQAELTAALELWQGEPFTGFAGSFFDTARQRLVELRAVALETRAELELASGRHRELVGELVELVAEFPVRERLRHQLMLALYRSGRQAEALAAYREFTELLREEYGIEPGEVLRALHLRILRSDPTLLADPRTTVDPAGAPVPAQPVPARSVPAQPVAAVSTAPAAPVPPSAYPGPVGFGGPPPAPPGMMWPGWVVPPTAPVAVHPGPSRGVPRWLSVAATVAGALTALASFGLLTWLVVLVYALWRRSWPNGLAAAYYLAMGLTFVIVVGGSETEEVSDTEGYLIVAWLLTWLVGVLHAILLNGWLVTWLSGLRGRQHGAEDRRLRREQARYLLYHYPGARWELRIGRPDLPRGFDDGGLVDVNAVPDEVISGLPGVTALQAQQIALDRRLRGPFTSMEELAARCLLPPALTDSLRDLLVFFPPMVDPASSVPRDG